MSAFAEQWKLLFHGETLRIGLSLLALLLVVIGLIFSKLRQYLGRSRRRRRARRAASAEEKAASVLRNAGYRIVEEQARIAWRLSVDGQNEGFTLIADYLVMRWGTLWVAEVKTGERALALQHGPTRRQLLEYSFAFGVRGVLLVDAERGRLRRVSFPGVRRGGSIAGQGLGLIVSAVLGYVIGWASH